ncbi:hypothetical protein BJY52DRAFT_335816 [Lactarius psammicola]|nr:hypothetical protein BJY52DRAFT_335816 [Lactarius psammicola]
MRRNYHSILRCYSTRPALPADFQWFPRFFNPTEQHALLSAALRKLDVAEPRAARKRRRDFLASHQQGRPRDTGDLKDVFLPDEFYHFEEGHYDGVIKRFRELASASVPTGFCEWNPWKPVLTPPRDTHSTVTLPSGSVYIQSTRYCVPSQYRHKGRL